MCSSLYRKILVFTMIVFFVRAGVFPVAGCSREIQAPTANNGNTIIVDDEGDGDYTSIQDAVDNASLGDTIYVYSGKYEETTIQKKVILKGIPNELENGNDSGKPVIEGDPSPGRLIYLSNVNDCIIQGFELLGGMYGIMLIDSSNNKIFENNISSCYMGIKIHAFIEDASNNLVEKNNITYNDYLGIRIEYSSNNIICGNRIEHNRDWGVDICSSPHNEISNNIFLNNGHYSVYSEPTGAGVSVGFSFRNIIRNNHFEDNIRGVFIATSLFSIVKQNNFIENKEKHVFVYGFASFTTRWQRNYWDDYKGFGPKVILGEMHLPWNSDRTIKWLNFDWRPAKEPYDI